LINIRVIEDKRFAKMISGFTGITKKNLNIG
jgi:hypothetical protein